MGAIDKRVASIEDARRSREREAADRKAARARTLNPSAKMVARAIRSELGGNRGSWELETKLCLSCPCVEVWRKHSGSSTKLADFLFSYADGDVIVHLESESRRMSDGGTGWASNIAVERAANSFYHEKPGFNPLIKWSLIVIAALFFGPILIGVAYTIVVTVVVGVLFIFGIGLVISLLFGG